MHVTMPQGCFGHPESSSRLLCSISQPAAGSAPQNTAGQCEGGGEGGNVPPPHEAQVGMGVGAVVGMRVGVLVGAVVGMAVGAAVGATVMESHLCAVCGGSCGA